MTEKVPSHAETIGLAAMKWNNCQTTLLLIFTTLMRGQSEAAAAVFLALRADSHQREITLAAADSQLRLKNPEMLKRIRRAVSDLAKLQQGRNDAIHTMWAQLANTEKYLPFNPVKYSDPEIDYAAEHVVLIKRLADMNTRLFTILMDLPKAF